MLVRNRLRFLFTSLLVSALSACGGSGGSDNPPLTIPEAVTPTATPKGIEGGGIINSFGAEFKSITVGGVEYDTTDTGLLVTVDGVPAMISDLNVGNVVRVTASTDDDGMTSVASEINQINDLEGVIEAGSIDLEASTFVVLQQTVRIVATTIFDDISPPSIEGLADGDRVEVSVLPDGLGGFTASRIEFDDDPGFEITGIISNLDTATSQFNIGGLVVDFSAANLSDLPNGQLSNGLVVEVEGLTLDANGVLLAQSIDNESPEFEGNDGDLVEIEGYVTRFESSTDFDVNGLAVSTNAQTVVEYGQLDDIALGVRVEVEGELTSQSVVLATKIEIESQQDEASIEFEAPIESVDEAGATITVLGQILSIVESTSLEDDSDAELVPFNVSDLMVGDFVEVKAYLNQQGQMVAVQVERDDAEDEVRVQGPIADIVNPNFVVAGVAVATTGNTEFEQPSFFTQVIPGDIVQVDGQWDGVTLTARSVEFED